MLVNKKNPLLIHNFPSSLHEAFAKAQSYSEKIKAELFLFDNIRSVIHQGSSKIQLSFLESIPLLNKRTNTSWSHFTTPLNLNMDFTYPFSPRDFAHKKVAKQLFETYIKEKMPLPSGDITRIKALFSAIDEQEKLCTLVSSMMCGIQKS